MYKKGILNKVKIVFFVQGDPGAILVVEFLKNTREEIIEIAKQVEIEMRSAGLGYHFPLLFGDDSKKNIGRSVKQA